MSVATDTGVPRALFITLSNIGDLILTTPALEALHAAYPEHLVDIVGDARSSELLRACPYLGTLFHRHKEQGKYGMWRLIRQLRARSYAAIVDLRTGFLPWLLRAQRRTAGWRRPPHGAHAVEQHFAVTTRVLPTVLPIPETQVWISGADEEKARDLLRPLPAGRRLALAPGANWPGKIWPAAHFALLLETVADLFSGVVIFGGTHDAAVAEFLTARCSLPCLNLAGKTTLTQTAAALSGMSVFVGNDSGLGHLAAARRVPTLTLFGPGRPERYRPWGPHARILVAPNRDLAALKPGTAVAGLRALLANEDPRR